MDGRTDGAWGLGKGQQGERRQVSQPISRARHPVSQHTRRLLVQADGRMHIWRDQRGRQLGRWVVGDKTGCVCTCALGCGTRVGEAREARSGYGREGGGARRRGGASINIYMEWSCVRNV